LRLEVVELVLGGILERTLARGAIPAHFEGRPAEIMARRRSRVGAPGAPRGQQAQGTGELEPCGGELVGDARGPTRIGAGHHQRMGLEVLEALGEDVGRDPFEAGGELAEAPGPTHQGLDDEQGPAVPDALDRLGEGRAGIGGDHA
jgi:hypothetical protein